MTLCQATMSSTPFFVQLMVTEPTKNRLFCIDVMPDIVSRVSLVSVVSGYGLDDRAIEVRSQAEAK
jgi:hypothetical protein